MSRKSENGGPEGIRTLDLAIGASSGIANGRLWNHLYSPKLLFVQLRVYVTT